jgi:hypothetical protein
MPDSPLTIKDIRARVDRLDKLSGGLSRERVLWEEAQDPLLYLERQAYLQAVHQAIGGVEAARVVLVRACQRIEAEVRSREAEAAA